MFYYVLTNILIIVEKKEREKERKRKGKQHQNTKIKIYSYLGFDSKIVMRLGLQNLFSCQSF